MYRKHVRAFLTTAGSVCILGLLVALWTSPPDEPPPDETETQHGISAVDLVRQLMNAGWERGPAEAVVDLNREWFEIQAEENPAGLRMQLKLLERLGEYSELGPFLADYPETAILLAGADDPRLIADPLRASGEDYQIIAGLFVQHVSPQDSADVALALRANQDVICRLRKRGLIGCEVLFIFDREGPAADEYEKWLREAIDGRLLASDDELASFVRLVMHQGPVLRDRLRDSEEFRQRFRGELWPRLVRAVDGDQGMFELYLDDGRIWDLIALDNGEELIRRCGLLPIDLLYGYPEIGHSPYPESLHPKIIQILLRREEIAIHALMKFRREPLFRELMERQLPPETLAAALQHLFNAGPNYPEKLALYSRLTDTALADEVGEPASGVITWVPFYYTVYEVPKKLLQGREPTGMDLFAATIDPVFLVVDIFTGGGSAAGRKALLVGGKSAGEAATKKLSEKGAEKLFVTTLRDTGLEMAKKRVGREAAEKMGEKELINWRITALLSEMQQAVGATIGRATTFEITKPVQFMFQYSGVGRESWKRFTGLEANLFMRGDARVYVRLTNLSGAVVGSRGAAFLNRTAQDLTIGTAVESEPGQELLQSGVQRTLSAKEQIRSWQQNVSAWWLLNASMGDVGAAGESAAEEAGRKP